ncbi:MAG: transcription-repair coupling factor [Bacteroidota bacterium]|nr:transcription-repair coupling factor [Bacteroidota bacterium]
MINTDPESIYLGHANYGKAKNRLKDDKPGNISVEGLTGSSRSLFLSCIFGSIPTTHFVILPEKEDAAYFYNDLVSILGEEQVFFFPSSYKRSIQYGRSESSNLVLRTEVLNYLATGRRKCIVVSYPESVMEKVISKKVLKKNTIKVSEGDSLSMDFLEEVLAEYNFSRVDFVYEPGQYAVRGSIIDVFSYTDDKPYRVDFFGDDIESIRSFNTEDQLSVRKLKEISIVPNIQDITIEKTHDDISEFIPPSSVVWLDNFEFIKDRIENIYNSTWTSEDSVGINEKSDLAVTGKHLESVLSKFKVIEFAANPHYRVSTRYVFNTSPQPSFNKDFEMLGAKLLENSDMGYTNLIISESETQIKRIKDIFSEINPGLLFETKLANLHEGFTDHELAISVFTDHQIFERYHKFRIKGRFSHKESLSIKELTSLNPGDYVVHVDHGIGRFGGLEKVEINGKIQENIKLVYKDNDTLYVGIHALHRISKYKAKDNAEPRIYKLGTGAWQKLKVRTKNKIKDNARDLILLYAKRRDVGGFSFSPDTYLQRELEASFIYEDTPDQLAATDSVKEDMEKSHPMDRLICGDVGFGKTEIAIRAAFKAAADSKQTAILVPTTILALQHYQTFTSRLEKFPVSIDYISRHKNPSQQKEIIRKLKTGELDIVIGTHKLVGKEVEFKNLGLLIVDEEQRFGVAVKEKLKKMRTNVDTLTLTATPIPRTLQFSLMGARDLSIINTPPPNRMPIVTELHGFNEEIIKEGIEYELNRNGQVFFIHNRVDTIEEIKLMINRILPGVKTAVVHGQIEGRLVENTMFDFVHGDYDVLVATTIIESGLDIPNANTIFINNAHQFGLSELHQLRGRVGRSNKKAFCYLLTPPLDILTREARQRLRAIEEFSGLGSGFNIAMQDLDIRGSGNLLGAEQSGFIADVGFETYQRILDEAMHELREEELHNGRPESNEEHISKQEHRPDKSYVKNCQIDTDLEIMFPDDYVSNISERIRLYKELNNIESEDELHVFEEKLIDRFGKLPAPAIELLNLVRLRHLACRMAVEKIVIRNDIMVLNFISDTESAFYKSNTFMTLIKLVSSDNKRYRVKQSESRLIITVRNIKNIQQAINIFRSVLEAPADN